MPTKNLRKRRNAMVPKNTIISAPKKFKDDSVTVTLSLTFKKSSIPVENPGEEVWREEVWPHIKSLVNINNEIAVQSSSTSFQSDLKALYNLDYSDVYRGVLSHVCILGMQKMSKSEEVLKSSTQTEEPQGGLSAQSPTLADILTPLHPVKTKS